MSKIENILTSYPLIISLHNAKYNLKEICNTLHKERSLDINHNTLYPILSKIKSNQIHPEYDLITPLFVSGENVKLLEPYSIKFNTVWVCFTSNKPKKEWQLNQKTLMQIPDPVGLLYMKRFLKLYHLSDEFLLQTYEEKYGMKIMLHEQDKIKNINQDIRGEYEKIISELKHKNLDYILEKY